MASPWKIGSKRMTKAPTTTAAAVSSMGRKRTAPASTTASASGMPWARRSSMKSTRMIELRTMMPAPAMKPIIEVAVKKAPRRPWAGRMPTRVSGMGAMITNGVRNERNQPTTSTGADVVRKKKHLLALHEVDRVLDTRGRLIAVIERHDRDRPTVDAAALVDLGVVGQRAAVELDAEAGGGALERGAHADLDVAGAHAWRPAQIDDLGDRRLTPGPLVQAENTARHGPPEPLEHRPPVHRHCAP